MVLALGGVTAVLLLLGGDTTSRQVADPANDPIPDPLEPGGEVPRIVTMLSPDDAREALNAAFQTVTGEAPTPSQLALLMAQSALETGHWKSMHNNNFGNVATGTGKGRRYFSQNTQELIGGAWKPVTMHFRAYGDPLKGAIDFVRTLRVTFGSAWSVLIGSADPGEYVRALKAARYFTAPEGPYITAVQTLTTHYMV